MAVRIWRPSFIGEEVEYVDRWLDFSFNLGRYLRVVKKKDRDRWVCLIINNKSFDRLRHRGSGGFAKSGIKEMFQCPEEVKAEAKVCRFCGYNFPIPMLE